MFSSSIDLASVPKMEHQYDQLVIDDLVNHPIVSHPNPELAGTAFQLNASRRAWLIGQLLDRRSQTPGSGVIKIAQYLRS